MGGFFSSLLGDAHGEEYRELFHLPQVHDIPAIGRAPYQQALEMWSEMGRAAARNLNMQTQGNRQLLPRLMNKIKHGLNVGIGRAPDGMRFVYFHPEAGVPVPRDLWSQRVTPSSGAFFIRETFAVARLLGATLDATFGLRFQRQVEVRWRNALAAPSVDRSLAAIRQATSVPEATTWTW